MSLPTTTTPALRRRGGPAPTPCDDGTDTAAERTPARPTFGALPVELHLEIAEKLSYPDALSLKQTNKYFRELVRTDMKLKVDWLLERRKLHLDCPSSHNCNLGSDLEFCRGSVA